MARRDCLSPKRKERTKVYIISFSQAFFCIHYLPFIYHLLTFDQEKSSTPAHRRTKTASISNGHTSSMGKRSRAPHCIYLISFIFFTSFVSFPCLSLSLSLFFFFDFSNKAKSGQLRNRQGTRASTSQSWGLYLYRVRAYC